MADDAISTSNVWPYYSAMNTTTRGSGPDGSLGKNEFLQILVAQISNQDPLDPMGDTEFIAQMAQFSSLEQMMNMAEAMGQLSSSLGLYASMIGKQIGWESLAEDGTVEVKTGTVDSLILRDGELHVVSGEEQIPMNRVVSVFGATPPEPDEGGEGDET